jgi:membrane protease subunit (stomatin/prohibitin family)
MAILDFISKQFIDIIQWTDDSRDTLSYRFPDEDKEIKRGAQLIVRESQIAQFVYLGQFGDTFGPGKYTLTTDNIPILSDLQGWKYGLESPFKADVYYVLTRLFTGNKWGTANPVMMRDQDFGVVRLRAFGIYDFKIVEPKLFLKEVAGTDDHFRLDEFNDTMRSRIVSVFSEALAASKIPALDVAARYAELGEALLPLINPQTTSKYGLEVTSFIVENVSVPPEVEQAIDKRSSMAAVGNLNDYVKFQMAQGMEKGDGGGVGGMAAQMAVGVAMAQQMMNQT